MVASLTFLVILNFNSSTHKSRSARNSVHVPLDDLPHLDPAVADVARTDFKRLRGHLNIQATYKVLAMIFEGVTERVYGRTFALRGLACDPQVLPWPWPY